jgi:hypothetical protein
VTGKAKVMSYDDIVEAQRKRDAKEAGIAGGTRRSSKRKTSAPAPTRGKRSRTEEAEEGECEIEALGIGSYCSILQF